MTAIHPPTSPSPGANSDMPMQFTTYNGNISWIGVTLLALTITGFTLTIIRTYLDIQAHRENRKRDNEMEREIIEIKRRVGLGIGS